MGSSVEEIIGPVCIANILISVLNIEGWAFTILEIWNFLGDSVASE